MCGFAVVFGDIPAAERADVLRRMVASLVHRGPDADGFAQVDQVSMGFRRLAIIDTSSAGDQPMHSSDGALVIVFNGEIYNYVELRTELERAGYVFRSRSDTEVLLCAYRHWGKECLARLRGMWAFVIYDRDRRRLFASRDRFGKKPFYYFHERTNGDATFAFASELPALALHPACPREVSRLSLKKYFAYCYIPAPRSVYERVWKLPGGHSLSYDLSTGNLRTWRYWEYLIEPDPGLDDHLPASERKAKFAELSERYAEEIRAKYA